MSEMLVDGAKLDACNTAEADAIRAKTGGTDHIPYDFANNKGFADAIAAIETGGGAKILTKLATYTVSDSVATISITATDQMRSCEMLFIECVNLAHTNDWIYPVVNNVAISSGGMGYTSQNSNYNSLLPLVVPRKETINGIERTIPAVFLGIQNSKERSVSSLTSIELKQYSSPSVFTGGTVNIWGYV